MRWRKNVYLWNPSLCSICLIFTLKEHEFDAAKDILAKTIRILLNINILISYSQYSELSEKLTHKVGILPTYGNRKYNKSKENYQITFLWKADREIFWSFEFCFGYWHWQLVKPQIKFFNVAPGSQNKQSCVIMSGMQLMQRYLNVSLGYGYYGYGCSYLRR